jgi:hypothetical protein
MYEDILGDEPKVKIRDKSEGDTLSKQFSEVWAEKQRIINNLNDDFEDDDDDFEDEDLQLDSFMISYIKTGGRLCTKIS